MGPISFRYAGENTGGVFVCTTVESGYQAHIAIKRTFAIRRMLYSCQNLYEPLLTGALVGDTKLNVHEYKSSVQEMRRTKVFATDVCTT